MRKALDGGVLRDVMVSVIIGVGGAIMLMALIFSLNQ